MHCTSKSYCDSIQSILDSEAKITCYSQKYLFCNITKWLNCIPEEEKRIRLFISVMQAYTNRTCAVSQIICSSKDLLKCCNKKKCENPKQIAKGIYILEKVYILQARTGKINCYFLVYCSRNNKTVLVKYASRYDDEKLKVSLYHIK